MESISLLFFSGKPTLVRAPTTMFQACRRAVLGVTREGVLALV